MTVWIYSVAGESSNYQYILEYSYFRRFPNRRYERDAFPQRTKYQEPWKG